MVTVVFSKTSVRTVSERFLTAGALNIIQPNLVLTSAKEGFVFDFKGIPAVHLSARDSCFLHAPFVITNGSPLSIVEDFHSARAPGTIFQPNWFAVCQMEKNIFIHLPSKWADGLKFTTNIRTWTDNGNIYTAFLEVLNFALWDGGLIPRTGDFDSIQVRPVSKMYNFRLSDRGPAVNLSAHHTRLAPAPVIGACSFPVAVMVDLHSAIAPIASIDHLQMFYKWYQ